MIHCNHLLKRHIIKVMPKYAVSYTLDKYREPHQRFQFEKRVKKDKYSLSKQAKKNMNNCFAWLRIISNKKKVYSKKENKTFKFELSFITLTLPSVQLHSDEFIKKHMLSPFLKWMQRSWDCNSYIWKAETQNNGNIHFHITTNKFIHWKSMRAKWNRLLAAHNYCKVFQDGTNDKGDAATNIKAVVNSKAIEGYVANYCTKKDTFKKVISDKCELNYHFYQKENYRQIQCEDGEVREYKRRVNGRLWNASYNLNVGSAWIDQSHEPYAEMVKLLQRGDVCKEVTNDFADVYIYQKPIFKFLPPDLKRVFYEARAALRANDGKQTTVLIDSFY